MNKKDLQNAIREFLLKDGNSPITEANLTKAQLDKREDYLKQLKKNKKELVKRYGKDAESVMYGRATNLAKKAVSEMNKQKIKELVRKSLMNEADIETMADKIGGEEELSLASNLLDDFESKLKSHDWYYMMSDDNRAYTKGSAEESELKKIAKQLSDMGYGGDAAKIFNQYNVFKNTSFSSFITPPEPFIPGYKRKQMGLDEKSEFPDLTGDGKVTKADILKGRGVDLDEDLDLGHQDNEPHMIKAELYRIGKYAMELYQMVDEFEGKGEVDFPAWWQSKITKAQEMMVSAKHYLDFEIKEPTIDAMVGVASDEEVIDDEASMMNEDEVTKTDELAAKIFKALKGLKIKDASYDSDKDNLMKARKALNKGNEEAAEKIAKPYISEDK